MKNSPGCVSHHGVAVSVCRRSSRAATLVETPLREVMDKPWPIRLNIIGARLFTFWNWSNVFVDDVRLHAAIGNACVHHLVEEELPSASQIPHISSFVRAATGEVTLYFVEFVAKRIQSEEGGAERDVVIVPKPATICPSIASDGFAINPLVAVILGVYQ